MYLILPGRELVCENKLKTLNNQVKYSLTVLSVPFYIISYYQIYPKFAEQRLVGIKRCHTIIVGRGNQIFFDR